MAVLTFVDTRKDSRPNTYQPSIVNGTISIFYVIAMLLERREVKKKRTTTYSTCIGILSLYLVALSTAISLIEEIMQELSLVPRVRYRMRAVEG